MIFNCEKVILYMYDLNEITEIASPERLIKVFACITI